MDVVILDGNQKATLAATRSLGGRGLKVFVGDEGNRSLAGCSRYCHQKFSYPSPYLYPDAFHAGIQEYISGFDSAVLLPMTDVTVDEVLRKRNVFSKGVRIPFAEYNQYGKA